MKITIVYDSIFGNTAHVAKVIAVALRGSNAVRLLTVHEAKSADLADTDLLIVGSPTRGFRPTPTISEYVERLGTVGAGKAAAVFDTRLDLETIEPPLLRWVVVAGGYAATRRRASHRHSSGTASASIRRRPDFSLRGPRGRSKNMSSNVPRLGSLSLAA